VDVYALGVDASGKFCQLLEDAARLLGSDNSSGWSDCGELFDPPPNPTLRGDDTVLSEAPLKSPDYVRRLKSGKEIEFNVTGVPSASGSFIRR
jgi:hypothetical protein